MSAEKKKHDFHLVDPSPWPIYVSFATLGSAVNFGGTLSQGSVQNPSACSNNHGGL